MGDNEKKLVCDQQSMVGFYLMLTDVVENLQQAYELAEANIQVFDGSYHGDAEVEIDMFLKSLPLHLYRLMIFYTKLMNYIATTAMSMYETDMQMTENMESD